MRPIRLVALLGLALLAAAADPARPQEDGPPPEAKWTSAYGAAFEAVVAEYAKAKGNDEKDRALAKAAALGPFPTGKRKTLEKVVLAAARRGPRSDGSGTCTLHADGFDDGTYVLTAAGHGKGVWLGLHGGGFGSGEGRTAASLWGSATGRGLMGVFPTAPRKLPRFWNTEFGERFVLAILRELKRTFRVDTNRIYVGGHSMGGEGAWNIGGRFADRFAGVTANAGGPDGAYSRDRTRYTFSGGAIANLCNTPIWFFHSIDDPRTGVLPDQEAARFLGELRKRYPGRYRHVWKEYTDRGHGMPPEGIGPIVQWVTSRKRDPWPDLLVWEPSRPYYRLFSWLRMRTVPFHLHGHGHRIVARRKGNRVEIETGRSIRDLSLLLPASAVDRRRPFVVTWNGKSRFEGYPRPDPRAVIETAWERIDPAAIATYRIDVKGPD
jgi:acetyl esterase/lipase